MPGQNQTGAVGTPTDMLECCWNAPGAEETPTINHPGGLEHQATRYAAQGTVRVLGPEAAQASMCKQETKQRSKYAHCQK